MVFSCGSDSVIEKIEEEISEDNPSKIIKILSLGDSYTIGQSVCEKCKFPSQLLDSLKNRNATLEFELKVIATTGWTTNNLINSINSQDLTTDYRLATLLIGVNNQYQGISFSVFEEQFSILIETAIKFLKGNKNRLIVLSIPDYAFTPFGQGNSQITSELETYNSYIKNYCINNNITFLNITDITQEGLNNPDLVASDGLHPSELAYTKFVERLLPLAIEKLKD